MTEAWSYRTKRIRRGAASNRQYDKLFREVASNLSIGQRAFSQTFAAAPTQALPSNVNVIETLGYSTPGDGGGARFVRADSEPATGPKFQNGGRWFGMARGESVNVRQFGAVLDGVTDDKAAFEAADAFGVYPIIIDGPAYLSTVPSSRVGQYLLVGPTASVNQNGANFLPGYKDVPSALEGGRSITRALLAADDPSPTITGAEYPMPTEAQSAFYQTYNYWGAQGADINDPALGRTGMFQVRWQFTHLGEGDGYNWIGGGTVFPHGRIGDCTSIKGQPNGGIGGGQWNAGGDQVTLYGIGDIVEDDKGFDNVSIRGVVLHLHRSGDDDAYGYRSDSFGLRVFSRETGDIGNVLNAQGPFEVGLSLTRVECSSDVIISLGEGQKISFDDSAALPTNSYNPETFGTFWIQKTASEALELAAAGNTLEIDANGVSTTNLTLSPSSSLTTANNGELAIEATNNTTITFKFRGDDGVERTGTITLS